MAALHALHRIRVGALACVLLLQAACVADGSSGSSSASLTETAQPTQTATLGSDVPEEVATEPALCASEGRSWTVGAIATRRLVAYSQLGGVVVSRTGTATVAWTASVDSGEVRTMDDPATPGDPRSPAGPPDPKHRESVSDLGIDAADVQTLLWLSDERGSTGGPSSFSEYFDVVVADRSRGGEWSSSPSVLGAGYVWQNWLAVNASGAAAVAWYQYGGPHHQPLVYAAYREAAGVEWTPGELVAKNATLSGAGIDDAGRVVLLYIRQGHRGGVYAVRRSRVGGWGTPHRLAVRNEANLTVGADGSAIVLETRIPFDAPSGSQFTLRMTPSGRWQRPVRQPALTDTASAPVGIDAHGRALLAWWNGADLMVRWSRPDGRWRKPCVLAADVKRPRSIYPDAEVVVNRRGDALAVWKAKGRAAQLWARYKPAGHGWTKPVKLTRTADPPGTYTAALGDGGHAAVTWMPWNGRQVHVVRVTPRS